MSGLTRRVPLRRRKSLERRSTWGPTGNRKIPHKAKEHGEMVELRRRTPPKRHFRRGKKRPPATAAEKAHMKRVRKLPCICCLMDELGIAPTNLHHPREQYGESMRASHWEVLPICEGHHQGMKDTSRLAFHKASRTWRLRYGNEVALLKVVWGVLGLDFETLPELRGSEPPWWQKYKRGGYDEEVPENVRRILTFPQEESA